MIGKNLSFLKTGLMYLGLLLSTIATFLGAIHFFKGPLVMSVITTLILILFIYFLLEQLIKKKEELRKKSSYNRNLSIFLYSLYLMIGMVMSYFSIHGLNVELNLKNQVKQQYGEVQNELNQISEACNAQTLKLITDIDISLQNLITLKKYNKLDSIYNLSEELLKGDKMQIRERKTEGIMENIVQKYDVIIKRHKPEIINSLNNISNWNLLELHSSLMIVDSQLPILKKELEDFFHTETKKYEFTSTLTLAKSTRQFNFTKPIDLIIKNKAYSLLLIVLFQHFLLLAPLLLTYTPEKYNPKKISDGIDIK